MEISNNNLSEEPVEAQEPVTLSREQVELAMGNTGLVYSIVWEVQSVYPPLDIDEAVGNGNYGLLKAASNYKPGETAFSTYAYRCIKGEILSGERRYKGIEGQKPSALNPKDRSLYEAVSPESDEITYANSLTEGFKFTSPEAIITLIDIERAIRSLSTRERDALLSFLGGHTLMREIAEELGVSTTRAMQLFNAATEKVRKLASLPAPASTTRETSRPPRIRKGYREPRDNRK